MKKLALSLAVIASVTFAEGRFVGFDTGYDFNSKLKSYNESIKDGRANIGLKAGYDFDTFRVYGSYHYGTEGKDTVENVDVKWKNHKFLINADFTPEITNDLRLVLGGYTGVSLIDVTLSGPGGSIKDDASDIILGARLGAEYSLDSNNAVEFGLKTDYTKYDIEGGGNVKQTDTGLYLGYNYKF